MTTIKKPLFYKRDKTKVEISGDPDQVKWAMKFELFSTLLKWGFLIAIILILIPKASWLPLLWQWLKRQIPLLTFLPGAVASILALSG